ncbi:hypothetical protein AAIR29_12180 [Psychrobacter sp. FBL11]|uniref:Uncharacterized protein n=1 Tax=Psychrobacter saeujeotis TaxID=3143436 RepID=A0ABU9XDI1_9GAMM|nr:hypothetical protein [uncultured Psychrobacter sp.]
MSSYSFSHQFYQRWTRAPEQIRAAIVQELTDITTLLQTDTPYESFTFSLPDLDAHLDELYSAHKAEQVAAKALADKQAEQRDAAEQQRLAEEKKLEEEKARDAARIEEEAKKEKQQAEQAQKESDEQSRAEQEKSDIEAATRDKQTTSDAHSPTNNEKNDVNDHSHTVNQTENTIVKPQKGAAIDLSFKNPELTAAHESLIQELEMHVDDYLSEQMMQISEDLKSWLRAEVGQQLAGITEKNQAVEDIVQENMAKKH